jgi:hypothetical protein
MILLRQLSLILGSIGEECGAGLLLLPAGASTEKLSGERWDAAYPFAAETGKGARHIPQALAHSISADCQYGGEGVTVRATVGTPFRGARDFGAN